MNEKIPKMQKMNKNKNEYREFTVYREKEGEHGNYWCEICFEEGLVQWFVGRITCCNEDCIDEYWTQVRDHPDYAHIRGSPKQMAISDAKENPWLKPEPRDMNDITNEIKLWLAQYNRNIVNINNGLDVTKYEEYNYEEARGIFEKILKEESK